MLWLAIFHAARVSGPSSSSGGSISPETMSYICFPSSILHLKHLLVGSPCEVLIVLTIVVNGGLIDIEKIRTEYSSEESKVGIVSEILVM